SKHALVQYARAERPLDGVERCAEFFGISFCLYIGHHVADFFISLKELSDDICSLARKNSIELFKYAGHVLMDIKYAIRVLMLGKRYLRKIHGTRGRAIVEIPH